MNCGAVQKLPNDQWFAEISEIYSTYQAYELADGEEQLVLDEISGHPRKRSSVLLDKLNGLEIFPKKANVLDVGCGDGVTLRAMSECFKDWTLNGYELSSSKEQKLKAITGFGQLFTGDLTSLPEQFDVISMMHSLEHFPSPFEALKVLSEKMSDNGLLFIEVCNVDQNPFDLLVADHLMHFSPISLSHLVSRAGFDILCCETEWVKKEISLVARRSHSYQSPPGLNPELVSKKISGNVDWLRSIVETAQTVAATTDDSFGIFGTSIAASWLAGQLGDKVSFFVDEDPYRIGRQYLGRPVLHPKDVQATAIVYLALAPVLAARIQQKMSHYPWKAVISPESH